MTEEKMELEDVGSSLVASDSKKASVKPSSKFERLIQPCLAELVGTMFFVFIGCVSVIENVETTGRLQPALVHGLAVAVLVACMAEISGSHFNPPFTMAIYLCGENYAKAHGAAFTILQSDDQLLGALFGEVAMTCLVTMVVLLGAVNAKSSSPMVPFMVGSTVIINILAGGDVSGTCLNPARALGPAILANYWSYHWVYWVGPVSGGLVAAAMVRLLLGDRKTRVLIK